MQATVCVSWWDLNRDLYMQVSVRALAGEVITGTFICRLLCVCVR